MFPKACTMTLQTPLYVAVCLTQPAPPVETLELLGAFLTASYNNNK